MIVNYNWLQEWVDINCKPEELPELLAKIGIEVEETEKISGDTIYKIDITPNRGDLLSVIGISREIAAKTGKKLKKLIKYKTPDGNKKEEINVTVQSTEDCPRYTASPIYDINIASSPSFIVERLEKCGIRPLNNVVDITNYVLLETGQPLHAFDSDKIKGGITVRRAKKGENIITLEEEEKPLSNEDLIIADDKAPLALAGIMGGLESGISENTEKIVLESAFFKPSLIRNTSRKLKISTESSYRFERTVDMHMVGYAAYYAIQLLEKYASGKLTGKIVDTNPDPDLSKSIIFSYNKVNNLLGINLEKEKSIHILENLGLKVINKNENGAEVSIPSYRSDLKIEEDLVEEIGRFAGYNNIPLRFKFTNYGPIRVENRELIEIKKIMVRLGFWEAINIPFVESTWASIDKTKAIYLENPMWSDKEILRNSLIPGLLESARRNLNRGEEIIRLFEAGRVFTQKNEEEENIGGVIGGNTLKNWYKSDRELDFYDIKGLVEAFLEEIKILDYSFKNCSNPLFIKERALSVTSNGKICGNFGLIDQKVCKEKIYGFEFNIKQLLKSKREKRFRKTSVFPPLKRDISIVIEKNTPFNEIQTLLDRSTKQKARIRLIDVYQSNKIGEDKKSMTIRLEFYNPEKTLKDEEIKDDIKTITQKLEKIGAVLRE
ncbi:MAG: phenylalanine--tRNA ligase subunit beta [candidate division WOR-3 bacterium]